MNSVPIKQFVIDAFTDKVFGGNPAAICVLDQWPSDDLMIAIAKENNLSETAFTVKSATGYELRWFTPGGEIDLCGHATLGCAFVLLNYYEKSEKEITFLTASGPLTVTQNEDTYEMDFPAYNLKEVPVTQAIVEAIGTTPKAAYLGRDLLCVLDNANAVKNATPNIEAVKELEGLLLHLTARTDKEGFDCVSRSFAPKLNVTEDPVCGSGHCHIIPYWAEQLSKNTLTAYQASSRGGILYCRNKGQRVTLAGKAVLYSQAELFVPETL